MNETIAFSKQQRAWILDALRRMCEIFWGPAGETGKSLLQGGFFHPFRHLDHLLPAEAIGALHALDEFLGRQSEADPLVEHLEQEYVRLFVSNRGGIPAPLYHSCYESDKASLMGPAAVAMKRRMQSKGLTLGADIHEPPDHLSIELEYLYFLLENGWTGGDHEAIVEAATFASEAMMPWLNRFHRQLAREFPSSFYTLAAALLVALLDLIARQP